MTTAQERASLYEFMPYGAPELKEVAKKYMSRATLVAAGSYVTLFGLMLGVSLILMNRKPEEIPRVIVPYRELAAPPPLSNDAPPPQVRVATSVAAPAAAVPVPVPDAEAPSDATIKSQEEIAAATPSFTSTDDKGKEIVVAPPEEDELPKLGEYVYSDVLPEAITRVSPVYPDLAREAGVDGTVYVHALVGKDGRVKNVVIDPKHSIPMLDAAAMAAVRQFVFTPALSNNKPVSVWVAVPVKFSLH